MATQTAAPTQQILRLVELRRTFGDFVAVDGVDLDIADGEFFSLIGPSGCGKTTTLRMIAGLEEPSGGRIEIRGRDVVDLPSYRRPVNTVFQSYALFPHLSTFENVAFGLRERRASKAEIQEKVRRMLELVHLPGRASSRPADLSGGEQQRVALARSLVLEPAVLLLDEPLGALDLKLRKSMQKLLKEVQSEVGTTFLYVTHDQEEAFSMSTRVGVMNRGRLEQVDTPQNVYRHPSSSFVADFVGATNQLEAKVLGRAAPNRYELTIGGGRRLAAAGPAGGAERGEATLVVRPEGIVLTAAGDEAAILEGVIDEVSYAGPHTTYTVRTDDFGPIQVATADREEADREVSQRVGLSWEPSVSWVIFR